MFESENGSRECHEKFAMYINFRISRMRSIKYIL